MTFIVLNDVICFGVIIIELSYIFKAIEIVGTKISFVLCYQVLITTRLQRHSKGSKLPYNLPIWRFVNFMIHSLLSALNFTSMQSPSSLEGKPCLF